MSDAAFPDYVVTSNETRPGFYIFVLAYTALCFFLIAPLVTWSRHLEKNQLAEDELMVKEKSEVESQVIAGSAVKSSQLAPKGASSSSQVVVGKSAAVSSLASGSQAPPASTISKQHSVRSGRSGLGLILYLDKVAAAEYPDNNPDFQSVAGPRTVVSKTGTAPSSSGSVTPSAATTSRLHGASPSPKKLSSLVLDVGGRRWKNRRPIGRVDVIQNAISSERAGSAISALSSNVSKSSLPHPLAKRPAKGMSDLASSILEEQSNKEIMRQGGHAPFNMRATPMQYHRSRFLRRPSRAGSHSAASEKSMERSVMSSIVDDISPNDAADANDPGRGNIFVRPTVELDSSGLGCCSGFFESLLILAAPGEEMRRVVKSSIPLALGAASEAIFRLMTAGFVSRYLGTESMIAYLLVGLFVRLTSEELSSAIIDATSSFVQACLFSSNADGDLSHFLAGQYVQHAIVLQLLLGIPLLLVWVLTMEDVVYWLVQSPSIAQIASEYARVVVFYYLVQSVSRTCTVIFHICGHEHFESVIDVTTSMLQVIVVACVVAKVETASLVTVGYIQVLIGIAGAVAKVMYPVLRNWMKPFRQGLVGHIALLHNRRGFGQLARALIPLSFGTLLEYGEWEVLTLCLRHLGPAEVAAWAVLGAVWDILEALTEGIGEAAATQVAFLLAAWQPDRARKLANTVMYLSVIQSLVVTSGLYMGGKYIAVLLTTDPTLQHLINDSIALIGLANVTMAFAQVSWSLIGAQGRFRLATSVVFSARWFVTIPIALVTIFVLDMDLNGVSGSLVVGYATASSTLTFIVLRSDWERLSRIMQEMNRPKAELEHGSERDADAVDDHGDPFDDDSDDSSSAGFGFGVGGGDEDSEVPSTAISGKSKSSRRSKVKRTAPAVPSSQQ
jgi:Na+-driven multidrug efflux pump